MSQNTNEVLKKWKSDFSHLLNCPVPDRNRSLFEDNFSILEVKKVVRSAKRGKPCGFDEIPSEVLNNDASIYFLHVLVNVCFNKGADPAAWGNALSSLFQRPLLQILETPSHIAEFPWPLQFTKFTVLLLTSDCQIWQKATISLLMNRTASERSIAR